MPKMSFAGYEISQLTMCGEQRWFLDAVYVDPDGGRCSKNITNGSEKHCLNERYNRILAGTLGMADRTPENNFGFGDPNG